jgi:hypothetical protein
MGTVMKKCNSIKRDVDALLRLGADTESSVVTNRQSTPFHRHASACGGLTGYAVSFNRRRRGYGHLFQNRFT